MEDAAGGHTHCCLVAPPWLWGVSLSGLPEQISWMEGLVNYRNLSPSVAGIPKGKALADSESEASHLLVHRGLCCTLNSRKDK